MNTPPGPNAHSYFILQFSNFVKAMQKKCKKIVKPEQTGKSGVAGQSESPDNLIAELKKRNLVIVENESVSYGSPIIQTPKG